MNKDNISLEEKVGQWDFDSNWSYVRLVKWSKKDKNGSVKRYTLTGKIPPLNNKGNIDWDRFTSYNVFKGKVNSGLERRRNAEFYNAQLFDEI